LARFAETHSNWKRDNNRTLEDLLVALADTCWKGVRSETLEDVVCQRILAQVRAERWEVFAALDAVINDLYARHTKIRSATRPGHRGHRDHGGWRLGFFMLCALCVLRWLNPDFGVPGI